MGVQMTAAIHPGVYLVDQSQQSGTLTITNCGDTPVTFRGKDGFQVGEAPDGIDLRLPYGNGSTDLCSKEDSELVTVTSDTVGWTAEATEVPSGASFVMWRICPLECTDLKVGGEITVTIGSVCGNGVSGAAVLDLDLHTSSKDCQFQASWKKIPLPVIKSFTAHIATQSVRRDFLPLDAVADMKNEAYQAMPYAFPPPSPQPPPPPPPPAKLVQVQWETENAKSCQITYGQKVYSESVSGEASFDQIEGVSEVTLTAYGEEQVGQVAMTATIKK